jgi:hypothetical protein
MTSLKKIDCIDPSTPEFVRDAVNAIRKAGFEAGASAHTGAGETTYSISVLARDADGRFLWDDVRTDVTPISASFTGHYARVRSPRGFAWGGTLSGVMLTHPKPIRTEDDAWFFARCLTTPNPETGKLVGPNSYSAAERERILAARAEPQPEFVAGFGTVWQPLVPGAQPEPVAVERDRQR